MMYNTNSNISGMNNSSSGQTNEHHTESMIISNNNNNNNNSNQILGLDQQIQLDSLSNLFINNWETDDAALEQYENEMDRTINENLLLEKEQSNQRLFQSFQTSACAVAQMFKDKTAAASAAVSSNNNTSSNMSSWQSFQNSAGAITVLYKDSLEACKEHMDLGICIGQQRKLKEIITWIKKKKKRTIRKDELISFLIGKQYTNTSNQNQMFNLFNPNTNNNIGLNTNNNLISNNASNMSITSQQQQQTASSLTTNNRRQQSLNRLQQSQLSRSNSTTNNNNNNAITNTNTVGSTLNPAGENSSGSNDSQAVETNSDLATFREALIMHNRSRDAPLNRSHHNQHHHNQNINHHHHHNHINHHNQQNLYHSQQQQQNNNSITNNNSTSISTNQTNPQTNITSTNVGMPTPNCDDLDCFFCEQIATHIEHKRSAANSNSFNLDMESPTRKRGRFY